MLHPEIPENLRVAPEVYSGERCCGAMWIADGTATGSHGRR